MELFANLFLLLYSTQIPNLQMEFKMRFKLLFLLLLLTSSLAKSSDLNTFNQVFLSEQLFKFLNPNDLSQVAQCNKRLHDTVRKHHIPKYGQNWNQIKGQYIDINNIDPGELSAWDTSMVEELIQKILKNSATSVYKSLEKTELTEEDSGLIFIEAALVANYTILSQLWSDPLENNISESWPEYLELKQEWNGITFGKIQSVLTSDDRSKLSKLEYSNKVKYLSSYVRRVWILAFFHSFALLNNNNNSIADIHENRTYSNLSEESYLEYVKNKIDHFFISQ